MSLPLLRFMSYSEYLQTDHWRETRAAAIARTSRCALCPRDFADVCNGPGPQVHHRTYERLGEELAEDLVVLCAECHEAYSLGRQLQLGSHASLDSGKVDE